MTGPVPTEALVEASYVLLKRGLFYGPNNQGYTGVLRKAGRYTREDAESRVDHCAPAVTMMLASEAPAYSPACWHEVQVADLLDLLRIEREAKEAALAAHQQVTAERDAETQRANSAVIRAGVLDMARSNLSYHYHQALDAATNDDLPADLTLTLAERVTRYRDRWLAATAELARARAEGEALKADRDDAIRMLDVWFDTSTKTNEQVVPQLVDALVGYLRTCRCGGMPAETSDMIEAGAADFIRRRAGYIIAPVIEAMVAERTASLRAEGEAKDRALKDLRADAAELGARLGNTSQYDDRRVLRDLCWEAGNFLARRVIRTALARAATARER